jgi:hypothetical protein
MDDRTRRDEKTDNHSHHASDNGAERQDETHRRREESNERPALTRREREDPWPIG